MVASIPARQRSARRNQRCFCCLARLAKSRPRAGSATFFTPRASALVVFCGKKSAVAGSHHAPGQAHQLLVAVAHPLLVGNTL